MDTVCVFAVRRCHHFDAVENETLAVVESKMEEFAIFRCDAGDFSIVTLHKPHILHVSKDPIYNIYIYAKHVLLYVYIN